MPIYQGPWVSGQYKDQACDMQHQYLTLMPSSPSPFLDQRSCAILLQIEEMPSICSVCCSAQISIWPVGMEASTAAPLLQRTMILTCTLSQTRLALRQYHLLSALDSRCK